MRRMLSLLLIAAMLLSVCTLFTGCDDSGSSRKDDDEDEVTPTLKFNGLEIVLPEDFELESKNDRLAVFEGDNYYVSVESGPMTGEIQGMTAEELRDYCAKPKKPGDVSELETGKKNGTYYFYAISPSEEAALVTAFYTDDDYYWGVMIRTLEDSDGFDINKMIKLVTGWKCKAPKQSNSGNQGVARPDEPQLQPTIQPGVEATEPMWPVEPSQPSYNTGEFEIPSVGYDGSAVTIRFAHTMGSKLQGILNAYIEEFNKLYPNITVEHMSYGGWSDIKDVVLTELTAGVQPNIVYSKPSHVASYALSNHVVDLKQLVNSKIPVTRADGTTEALGFSDAQLADFIPSFYEGSLVYHDGKQYAMPLSRDPLVLYYNKTFFDKNNLAVPTTWTELEALCRAIKQIDPKCVPVGFDSEAALFLSYTTQTYTDYYAGGPLSFQNDTNHHFALWMRQLYQEGLVTTSDILGAYPSTLFNETNCYMVVSSVASGNYHRGNYEVGVAGIPQQNMSNIKTFCAGTDLCILNSEDPQETVASWLFLKFLTTNADFQAEFAAAAGYLPVTQAAIHEKRYSYFLSNAHGRENVTALAAKVSLTRLDSFFTPAPGKLPIDVTELYGDLLVQCMTAEISGTPLTGIIRFFNETENEIRYHL